MKFEQLKKGLHKSFKTTGAHFSNKPSSLLLLAGSLILIFMSLMVGMFSEIWLSGLLFGFGYASFISSFQKIFFNEKE
jgi:hypothetical protein